MPLKILKTFGLIAGFAIFAMMLVEPANISRQFQASALWVLCGYFIREVWE